MTKTSLCNGVRSDLVDQVVLITGAANGIGAETARRLVARGARVALLDRDRDALDRLTEELGSGAAGFLVDVADAASVDAAVRAAAERFGGIDTVVANAGISGPTRTVAAVDPLEFEQIIQINLLGVFRTVRAALPYVTERGGYVMVVSSIMAAVASPAVSGYAASKAGVEAFGRALRIELAGAGVRVGIAYFGMIDTGMLRGAVDSGMGKVLAVLPESLRKPAPVTAAGAVIVSGIERRARRVYAPNYVPLLLDLRTVLALADPLLARSRRIAELVRGAGERPVAANSVEVDQ
ncbi:MAG: short-chain dehydrogenase/reductase [Nocardia sp.]|uniref:short-chain dehydrogenase/reductase n=1 Tax=Nocardia sp. TaxID=1821 RepID=UPI002630B4A1|nr:short-chain dehydrogenase/reductase [Nocardia sp.]MCU1646260.1 short-chain dehydrogenase/reductase [Nocardia sp.]